MPGVGVERKSVNQKQIPLINDGSDGESTDDSSKVGERVLPKP